MRRETSLEVFPGVGPAKLAKLTKLGAATVGELLRHYPRQYEDRTLRSDITHAPTDRPAGIPALVAEPPRLSRLRRGLELVKVRVVDSGGQMELTFFNQAYVRTALRAGESYLFYGVAEGTGSRRRMTNPVFEREGDGRLTGRILPIYPLTAGLSNNLMVALVERALGQVEEPEELLPEWVRRQYALAPARFAERSIHLPEDWQALAAARKRLSFEEFFLFSLGLSLLRGRRDGARGRRLASRPVEEFLPCLPFAPTGAQRRAMEEIRRDLTSGRPMNRLVQGDVGSGKTAVAAYALWLVVKNGGQGAMMAPTELLARQHFATLSALLGPAGVRVGLLTASVKGAERKRVYAALRDGELDLVVGTHALLTAQVAFHCLALVVADEQHRFGVGQRAALADKGGGEEGAVHALVMSATPIPRTLALILYGDLEVSVLDELPPGRTPVESFLIGEDKRERMWSFLRGQVAQGRQAYIVCPLVEEGEEDTAAQAKAAVAYARELEERVFPQLRVGLLHGRLKPGEKQAVMSAFAGGEIDVLVSTTVIEVGVDVPNASLMIIENADRFGLSQLHQLRGRVGRGRHRSYCVLVSDSRNPETRARLKALCGTTDGFRIAEEDLKLRGPGDFFGQRQHGLPQMRMAAMVEELALLEQARQGAQELLEADPGLAGHPELLARVRQLFDQSPGALN